MARSRRRTPILSVTTSASDKPFKVKEHRKERRAVKSALASEREPPHPLTFGDPWNGPKDGKVWCDSGSWRRDTDRRPWDAK